MKSTYLYIRSVYLLVAYITINGNTQSKGDCDNDGRNTTEECCTNYYMVGGICKACPPGYFGRHCAVACPYPSFGVTCGDECQCDISECSHEVGCFSYASQTNSSVITDFSDNKYSTTNLWQGSETTDPKTASNSPTGNTTSTSVIVIVGGILSLFLLIIIANQIHGKVSRMKKKRAIKDTNNQHPDARNSEEYYAIDESQVIGSRYQHIETNDSLELENKNDAGHVLLTSPDQRLLPLRLLQKPTTLSSEVEEVCLDYYDTGQDTSCSNNPSSDGSYEKPVNNVSDHANDAKDGEILVFIDYSSRNHFSDIQNFESELHSIEHSENALITSHSQENTYLDAIHK